MNPQAIAYVNTVERKAIIREERDRNNGGVIDWCKPHSNPKERAHWLIGNIDKVTITKLPSTVNRKRKAML